ncbi:MAG: hypothetical protein A3D67_04565 [Candidatus Lloydbacteria bacterium RIFCSPHIGHO2_02_FULL_51_22]|uniref:Uncharacterized protein n=2 Tax=Candidatus Lloydiibacteriota TaxID=1817910 RepID=A0A1G2DF21_9BACT|nr:MAG: hypothetical protein A3D67_04565 [Candidatus Lloydbacteria bacterium RIFCSPHIGHO2_02_FULL_51_22]OGZ14531.1 MAG: hypothetical protein A3J08_02375 [Candidatus Lloydbacteria bacterium RIFCSPLOWO2_02_FULL_51_11]
MYSVNVAQPATARPHVTHRFQTLEDAHREVADALAKSPDCSAYVTDEQGLVISPPKPGWGPASTAEELGPPDDDEMPEDEDPMLAADDWGMETTIGEECAHHWEIHDDGLVHCRYGCGVRPHKRLKGEVMD